MRSFDEWFDENCDGSDLAKDACRKLWDEFSDQINIICRKSYEKQQSKVDELKLQVAEMKSRLNDAYTDGQSAMYTSRQSKVDELQALFDQHDQWLGQRNRDVQELYDINIKHAAEKAELQRRNQMLIDSIKEQGQKLVYQNEVIETQSEKLLGLRDEKAELQKRVDAVKGLAQTLWEKSEEKHQQGKVWESKTLGECADEILDVLEQALKGGEA